MEEFVKIVAKHFHPKSSGQVRRVRLYCYSSVYPKQNLSS